MASAGAGTGGAASGSSPGSFRKKKGKKRDGEGGSGSGTGSGSGSGKRDYRCYLQLGLHHMRHSIEVFRPTHALELMTTCCSIRDDARTHYAMQIAQLLAGKLSEAVEGLAEGGAIDNPKLKVKAAVARALAQARTDRLPMAERGLSKAAGLDPLVWHVHAARGLVMALQNKAEEAIAAWTVGIGHCPKATLLHCLKGMEEARGGEAAKAELSFNKAKSANRECARWRVCVAGCHWRSTAGMWGYCLRVDSPHHDGYCVLCSAVTCRACRAPRPCVACDAAQ